MLHQNPLAVYFMYILQSEATGRFYVGHCQDLAVRLGEHNRGQSKSTRSGKPWKLVYFEGFETKSEAVRREMQVKSWKSAEAIRNLLESS